MKPEDQIEREKITCASCGEICEPEDLRNDFHVPCGRSAR